MSERPRLLLVPSISELEWNRVRGLLEEWADVASYDLPGLGPDGSVGTLSRETVIERAIEELDARGWTDAVLVGDQFGSAQAVLVARAWPGTVRGLALGHACLNYARAGSRPAISAAVAEFQLQLTQLGAAAAEQMFVQGLELTYGADVAEGIRERLSPTFTREFAQLLLSRQEIDLEPELRALDVPLLLIEHRDCPLWTHEGYEDAVAAFPAARTAATTDNPGSSPEFAAALREFVLSTWPDVTSVSA
jgi:pimeloyl-ACP methyl ester carboxylesterase